MDLLFGFYNVDFAKKIKISIQKNSDANVIEIVSSEEDLLSTLANTPSIEGVLLTTDLATKMNDQRLEVLIDILSAVRENFPNITFTILSNEKMGHPMLAEIVEMGIYNIFIKNGDDFTIQSIIDSFKKPLSFNTAVKYRQVDNSIPWRRNLNKTTTMRVEILNNQEETAAVSEVTEDESVNQSNKQVNWPDLKSKMPKFQSRGPTPKKVREEVQTDWMLDDLHTVVQNRTSEKIIGTVVIGVTGVAPHIGVTHTAISIAKYLSNLGHSVALVEGNYSQDFDRIHSLYEGEKNHIFKESNFEINGINHFKYREEQNLSEIFSLYEYVVLDTGVLSESMYLEEFNRAHVKCVICSADEWKFHWIEEFQISYGNDENYNFLVPGATTRKVKDLSGRLDSRTVFNFPVQEMAYEPLKETEDILENIIGEFINGTSMKFGKGALVITSFISIVVTLCLLGVFWYLR